MSEISKGVVQWKRIWQLTSGTQFSTPKDIVETELLDVSQQLLDGILQYCKSSDVSKKKLEKQLKVDKQEKLLPLTLKLQEFLDIDEMQSWDILCYYLNEYTGSRISLSDYIGTESNMNKFLSEIWNYYSLERMIVLKIVKNILEYHRSKNHPFSEEYKTILDKIKITELRKSLIKQLKHLITETLPNKILFSDNRSILTSWWERKMREINEILQILVLVVDINGILSEELENLIKLFKSHSFGLQNEYLDMTNDSHVDLIRKVTFGEVSLFIKCLDVNELYQPNPTVWIETIIRKCDEQIITLHQNEIHGPILLTWMLLNYRTQNILEDEEAAGRCRQFGIRAVQLGVFGFLHMLISHPVYKDNKSLVAKTVRKSIYNHLSNLCELFDADGSVGRHAKIFDLFTELLSSPTLAIEFCRNEDEGIRSLFNTAIELFPYDFAPLSKIANSLSTASTFSNTFIRNQLEELPYYTEVYNSDKIQLAMSNKVEGEFILNQTYVPFKKIDYVIPYGVNVVIMDKKQTMAHFQHPLNYFNALHHEINELLANTLQYNEIDAEKVKRVTLGIKYLAAALKKIKNQNEISEEMVHPTEMVFDILIKFKVVPNPPIELLAQCLEVCAALIPLFGNEIFNRVVNLNILPSITNNTLDFKSYANGVSFESSLVGYYLVNFEKNNGKYDFLMAYLNFLKTYTKTFEDNIFSITLPGLVFLLREIFPYVNSWRFESELKRNKIYIFALQFFKDILAEQEVKDVTKANLLRNTCIYNLLNFDNGMVLLRFIAIGNSKLTTITENESNWMSISDSGHTFIVQLSMTILMLVLKLKKFVMDDSKMLTALETVIYTQPKQRDTLRIIPVVTSYVGNIFNNRIPILSCRLLRRFAMESFDKLSLLACLDLEPDQIRIIFLQRLLDEFENENLKISVLEFVEACIDKQSGLTEAFFNVHYDKEKQSLDQVKNRKNISDGILRYMTEYLEAVMADGKQINNPFLSRIMSLFHALWKNNMQSLVKDLMEKPNFWPSLCNPLFEKSYDKNVKAYSQLFNIIGIELFKNSHQTVTMDKEFKTTIDKLLKYENITLWIKHVIEIPENMETEINLDETPEWLSRIQSFKDFIVLLLRKKNHKIEIPEKSLKYLAETCLEKLVERSEDITDFRPFIVLSELTLIVVLNFDHRYTNNESEDTNVLKQIGKLLNFASISYSELHIRSKESILAIAIKSLDLLSSVLFRDTYLAMEIIRSIVEIICHELFQIENSKKDTSSSKCFSFILSVNLLKKIILVFENEGFPNWDKWFVSNKIFNRLLSCLGSITQTYEKREITIEILDLLILFAKGVCSDELLHCDIGNYLWLKLLPPKELLQSPFVVATQIKWHTQDWWPIYSRGIELVTILLQKHKHKFISEAVVFVGVHEEYLIDSIMLAKQTLENNVMVLVKITLELIGTLVEYEKEWRMEHSQSMMNLMRCIQILMCHAVSLLYRPQTLTMLLNASSNSIGIYQESSAVAPSKDVIKTMNQLIEIITICSKCLLVFSPKILNILADPEFLPTQWIPLIEIQFTAPKMNNDLQPQLTFGTMLSAVCLFTKSLNLQHYSFHEKPLNKLPGQNKNLENAPSQSMQESALINESSRVSNKTSNSPRNAFSKSLSVTNNSTTPSNELVSKLDPKLCLSGLEFIMTLLASQSLLALKDVNLSNREKQLIKRELNTELFIYHEFAKKSYNNENKSYLNRKKYGLVLMTKANQTHDDDDDGDDDGNIPKPKTPTSANRRSDYDASMRVKVLKNLHMQQRTPPSVSPINIDRTPRRDSSIATTSTPSIGNWEFLQQVDDGDGDLRYGQSFVKIVEEDYLHFLSNLFTIVCQSDD